MGACAGRNKQRESQSDRRRPNPDLRFEDRIYKKTIKPWGGPLTKSAAEVGPISKASDGNDRDGNDELGIKHPLCESTDMYNLPLELVDIILQKSYLHWVLNSSTEQRNEEVIRSLISVDVCFNKRITRQKFKKTIWRYLKEFYGRTKKRYTIIRNNRKYLENNIHPKDELISSLLSLNCITEEQSHFIQSQRSTRDKNYKLLYIMDSCDETKFSNFVNCLRRKNQMTVAKIIENGGVVRPITIDVTQRIEMPENQKIWGVTKLRNEIYILLKAHDGVQSLIRGFDDRYPFRLQTEIKAEEISIPTDIVSSEKENCLYVSDYPQECVWKITRETDDQHKIIKWLTIDYFPWTLSVNRDGELLMINRVSLHLMIYGSDAELIRSIPLTRDIQEPWHAVETSIGNFIITNRHVLADEEDEHEHEDEDEDEDEEAKEEEEDVVMEEGKQKELVSVVSDKYEHEDEDKDEEEEKNKEDVVMQEEKHTDWLESRQGKGGLNWIKIEFVVSELTRDAQLVIRRFIPSNETQQLDNCSRLSIDSDDRVFVASRDNDRVFLLESDLNWNRILCPTKEENKEQILMGPWGLFYDEEMKQLIVTDSSPNGDQVNVYT